MLTRTENSSKTPSPPGVGVVGAIGLTTHLISPSHLASGPSSGNKYQTWMKQHFPQDMLSQWLNCVEWTKKMSDVFPELQIVKGCISSKTNMDNYSQKYLKQYPHAWLVTPEGEIVDPTVKQFDAIGELTYTVWESAPKGRCMGCGSYHWEKDLYCGKCEYGSEDEQ